MTHNKPQNRLCVFVESSEKKAFFIVFPRRFYCIPLCKHNEMKKSTFTFIGVKFEKHDVSAIYCSLTHRGYSQWVAPHVLIYKPGIFCLLDDSTLYLMCSFSRFLLSPVDVTLHSKKLGCQFGFFFFFFFTLTQMRHAGVKKFLSSKYNFSFANLI